MMRIGSSMGNLMAITLTATVIQGINPQPAKAQGAGSGSGSSTVRTLKMTAQFAFRKSDTMAISDDKEVFLEPGKLVNITIGEFKIWAKRSEDRYEGSSLVIDVSDLKTGKRINHVLYQYGNDLHNQFIGGHGFTGLNYVNAPRSKAELQFMCRVSR